MPPSSVITHVNLARGFRGGERQTELLVRELARLGVEQRIVLRAGQPLVDRLADVPGLARLPIGKPFAAHLRKMRGAFLHAHDGKGAHFAHAAHRWVGARYVLTRRVDNRPSASRRTRRMYTQAAGVAVLSLAIDRVLSRYQPGLESVVIPSAAGALPVDEARAVALRQSWSGECVVGHVGALDDSQKGQHDLIAAIRLLAVKDAGWYAVLVGGGADEPAFRRDAADCRNIAFAGHVDNVGDYLMAFDLFAFPSVHEGLGSTLLDAMQAGLPIVASAVDGIPELIEHEVNGLLVAPRDPDALAAALARLRGDRVLARRLGEAGREHVRAYNAAAMAGRYLRWYARLGVDLGVDPDVDSDTPPD